MEFMGGPGARKWILVEQSRIGGNQVSNLRSRLGTYLKGGRLYKVDQVVANATLPPSSEGR